MKLAILAELNRLRAARRGAVLATALDGGAQRVIAAGAFQDDPLGVEAEGALRAGRSVTIEHDGARWFLNVQAPPIRLAIIGAVHVAQALAPMAARCGHDVTIIDPRTAFAASERFPGARVLAKWPDEAIAEMNGLDPHTAVAAVTHDPKIDDPALIAALKAGCFYVGALGSRKTHAKRVERLAAAGFDADRIGSIHAPIGLDIGATSPAEIAVSILAEIIAAQRKKPQRAGVS
jgi:xanthine dehydrogenase accessory factor